MADEMAESERESKKLKTEDQTTVSVKTVKIPRVYQTELLEHALRENTIVNLGTGAGKTFVAVMLIREMSYQTQGKFRGENGKRTIFLAHTVPLVKQQGNYVRDHTSLKVQDFCGDSKGIDNWPQEKWYELFDNNNVLAMSRQIFLDLLNRAIIKPRDLNLIVFDECHHATKNDPYVQIMKVIKDTPPEERPRVLGLSASLLGTKVKPGELKKGVIKLEATLMSCARTSKDLQEVVDNAATPKEKIINYSLCEDHVSSELRRIIEGPMNFLQTKRSDRRIKCPMGETTKNLFEDLYSILIDLGPASAASFIKICLKELRTSMRFGDCSNKYDYALATLGLTHLTIFNIKCREFEKKYGALQDSDKVKSMLLALGDLCVQQSNESPDSETSSSPEAKKNDIRGIIFVERRYTASCLTDLLKKKRKEQPDLRQIRCGYVVGHNVGQNSTAIRKEARMKSKKQDEVLSKFRTGHINILVATSVIEEGVDVPKCNLVIRFDLPQNFRAYVQSKGRARNKPSLFYLMLGRHQLNKIGEIGNYQVLEQELIQICQEDRNVPTEESIQEKMKDKLPPYFASGKGGARATLGNSLTILHRYCQRLPHDDYTKLAPIFEVAKIPKDSSSKSVTLFGDDDEDEDPKYNYICTVTLPINCPIKQPITGPPLGSKLQAHRGAALYAVEELHKLGELDDKFFPSPISDSDDEDIQQEKGNPQAGTEKRQWYWRNTVSQHVKGCLPIAGEETHLYVFVLRDASTQQLYSSYTSNNGPHLMMGLLTRKKLPYWKIPKFSLFVKGKEEGETEVVVTLLPAHNQQIFSEEELEVLKTTHRSIFSDVLKIIPTSLEWNCVDSAKDYLVVPVTVQRIEREGLQSVAIDYEVASILSNPLEHPKPSWPCPLEEYYHALVTVLHRDEVTLPVGAELYKVTVDHAHSPESLFPTPQFESFRDYYKMKHNYEIKDLNQPALKACRFGISSLKYLTSRYEGASPNLQRKHKEDKKTHTILFPEIVKIFPISPNVFKQLKCLPSILWRLESLLLAEELSEELSLGDLCFNTRIFTDTPLKGHSDIGFGTLPTQVLKYDGKKFDSCSKNAAIPRKDVFSRGPDNGLLLQALTPKSANDAINLERLELLGDSLLKIASSVSLLNARPDAHEKKLSSSRTRRVSNLKLYVQAKRKDFCGRICSNDILTGSESDSALDRMRYLPSGYVLKPDCSTNQLPNILRSENIDTIKPEEIKYLYHRFSDKMAADCMEALIGACTVAGGLEGGLKFIDCLSIGITLSNDVLAKFNLDHSDITMTHEDESAPLTIAQSSYIFRKYFGFPKLYSDANVTDRETFNRLISQVSTVQRKIQYQFKNHSLLIEAMTHSSYSRKTLGGCYQRLEFLGDAILDYLVSSYLYNLDQSMTPGAISNMKSALVCNHSLAELSVSIDLHKNLLHGSPELFKKIRIYSSGIKQRDEEDISELVEGMSLETQSEEGSDDESDEDFIEEDVTLDPPKPLSDIFESLCGAVFLDTHMNLGKTWEVFGRFLEPKIIEYRHSDSGVPVNPVKQLYDLIPDGISVRRKNLKVGYCCTIKIKDQDIDVSAESRSYKNAKIQAASKALQALHVETNPKS